MTVDQINELLDEMKLELGFKSEQALADYLDVRTMTLYRWRRGQFDKTKQVLVSYLLNKRPDPVPA
jgi:uncharacterized protein YcaQ